MEQARRPGQGSTVAQLKDDIASGRTGSKTATADPGLSPLGTDDEAGGRPNDPAVVAAARRQETARSFEREPDPGKPIGKWIIPATVVVVIALVALVLFLRS